MQQEKTFTLAPIGIIRTPYRENAPYQPVETDDQEFYIRIDQEFVDGLMDLDKFTLAYIIFWADRVKNKPEMIIAPPWADGKSVGLFSTRSPVRPNPIGLSVVQIKNISANRIYTSGLDVFDGTPLLDIKPYIRDLDNKKNANYGWLDEMDDKDHLMLHIKGIPHDY